MAAFSRKSCPVETDPDYNHETQLHSLTKNGDSVNCHPWASRGRRLFPQRRPSIPSPVSHNVKALPGLPPFKISPPRDQFTVDHQENDSNPSSPRSVDSVATVEVHTFPTPDQRFSETDPRYGEDGRICTQYLARSLQGSCSVERPITSHDPSEKKLETSFSAPLYNDTPVRGSLQWKSMAQFHKSGRHLGPRTRQSPESTVHTGLVPIEVDQERGRKEDHNVDNQDKGRSDVPALEIFTWNCTVKLSTVATVTGNGRFHVHHLAILSVIKPMEKLFAEKISLSIVVTNALRNDHKRNLGPGQSSLLFKEEVYQPGFFPREGAELVIVRDSCDLEKPLNLYFTFTYPSPCDFFMASLPTFRPKEGRSLSEVVFIAEPLPPLSMRTFIRDPLSSWKLCHHPVSQVTCYERISLPRLYPSGSEDDIQMRILELDPVHFRALGESTLSRVVWKFDITVHELPGELVECRMSFFLEVGAATALVSLVPHGWVPQYFIVDGRIATEKGGECWKNKEGHITIFKQAHMAPGPIIVETYWQRPPKYEKLDGNSTDDPTLPRVADRKVLGGKLTCGANKVVLLNHLDERIPTYVHIDGTYTFLPTMDAGYRILLKSVTEARSSRFRRSILTRPLSLPTTEPTQLFERSALNLDTKVKTGHKTGSSHTANNMKGKAAPPEQITRTLLLPLLVLLLLVPGSLLFVDYVRKGNNHSGRTSWRDQDPSTMSRDGENPHAIIDVAGLDPLQPAIEAVENAVEVAKCEGWRDWVDYGSGWKGCIP